LITLQHVGASAPDPPHQRGQEILRRNLNIQPRLTARPSLAADVTVSKDMVLRPNQPLLFPRASVHDEHDGRVNTAESDLTTPRIDHDPGTARGLRLGPRDAK